MTEQEILKGFKNSLYKKGKTKSTAESYTNDAKGYLEYLENYKIPLSESETNLIRHYSDFLYQKYGKINSVRRAIIGVRQFFRFLAESGYLQSCPGDSLIIPPRDESISTPLQDDDFRFLIIHTTGSDNSLKGLRDSAIVCLLALEGIKVSEVAGLKWSDFLPYEGLASLRITGTRGRIIQLNRESSDLILEYQSVFKKMLQSVPTPSDFTHMIIGFSGRDRLVPAPGVSRHGIKFLLSELAPIIRRKKLNTEMLRHFAITHHLKAGKSTEEIMQHLGLKRPGNIGKHLRVNLSKEVCQ